ncbi:MAG TPA: FtsX-like permease family protein, partial [Gemmatimonadaceae bacterium]|nr:FtsX-like permease family protein [Gemmatimonadaceae bacterium]
ALAGILSTLSALAWMGFAVAGFSILACYGAQTRRRAAEGAVRRSVGASLRGLFQSMLLEALALAAVGLALGRGAAVALLVLATNAWPVPTAPIHVRGMATALILGIVVTIAAASCYWAVRVQRLTDAEAEPVRLRVPVCQVGASVALLLVAAALTRPTPTVEASSDTNAPSDHTVVLTIDSGIADPASRAAGYASLLRDLSSRPATGALSLASAGAVLGLGTINDVSTECGQCFVGGLIMYWRQFKAVAHAVSSGSFALMHSRLVSGRTFDSADDLSSPRVAVVNRTLAVRYFEGGRGVGRTIFLDGGLSGGYRVVGIVDDAPSWAIGGALQPRETVYVSVFQRPPASAELRVASNAGSMQIIAEAGAAARRALGSHVTVRGVTQTADLQAAQRAAIVWCGLACAVMAVLVLLLALVGTGTTTMAWADAMAWELALRRAVGAGRLHIILLVLSRTAVIGFGGVVAGGYVFAFVLRPVLAASIAGIALPPLGTLAAIVLPPVLLTVLAGTIPGARLAWQAPSAVLR